MTRALIVLTLACAVLWAGLAALARQGQGAATRPEVVHVAEALREGEEPVAGLSLAYDGSDQRVIYARSKGLWRCLSVWNAPADGGRIERLLGELLDARGVVRAVGPQAQQAFGLGGPGSLELRLHGSQLLKDPEGDVLLRARFGAPSQVQGVARAHTVGSFAGLGDDERVLELILDPRAALGAPAATGLPPLLALRVAPPTFPTPGERVVRVFLDYADGTALELVRAERTPLPPDPGTDPNLSLDFEWQLLDSEGPHAIPPLRGEAFSTWAPRAPYDLLADPREHAAYGVDAPDLRLTLVPGSGEPLVLEIGRADALGRRWVLCRTPPQLARLDADMARMIAPTRDELTDSTLPNAWDAWLRAALSATPR